MIDDIGSIKQDFVRIVLAVETILNQRLGLDFLKDSGGEELLRRTQAPLEPPLELEY